MPREKMGKVLYECNLCGKGSPCFIKVIYNIDRGESGEILITKCVCDDATDSNFVEVT
jgi:hypothetical protein